MTTPTQPPALTQEQKVKTIAFVIVGILFLGIWMFGCGGEPDKKIYSELDALISSRQFVEKQLKSPASAQFDHSTANVHKLNDSTFSVSSFVDSQNGFGAMIRTKYSCQIVYHRHNNMMDCDNLKIE